ncbi:hypothetical protein [Pedobacter sp. GR22-6]|uniref:hypothetical protein n=1 Tax=Pedobacter sp. GR22-6 TaxID=3127957 RepID=UPI00307DDDA1
MIKTSTSVNKLNYPQQKQEILPAQDLEANDLVFYESIRAQLDSLTKSPSDEIISKILAHSKAL